MDASYCNIPFVVHEQTKKRISLSNKIVVRGDTKKERSFWNYHNVFYKESKIIKLLITIIKKVFIFKRIIYIHHTHLQYVYSILSFARNFVEVEDHPFKEIKYRRKMLHIQDDVGRTPLYAACSIRDSNIVLLLINNNEEDELQMWVDSNIYGLHHNKIK